MGCSQRTLRDDTVRRHDGQTPVLVRESGGGAVLTGPWMICVSVVLPPDHAWVCNGLVESYRALGQLHVAALQALGVASRALPPQEVRQVNEAVGALPVDWACFGSLSPWEVVDTQGRKLVGLAQRRQRSGVLLVAGTLISAVDWDLLCDVMGQPQDAPALARRTVCAQALAGHHLLPGQFAKHITQQLACGLPVGLNSKHVAPNPGQPGRRHHT